MDILIQLTHSFTLSLTNTSTYNVYSPTSTILSPPSPYPPPTCSRRQSNGVRSAHRYLHVSPSLSIPSYSLELMRSHESLHRCSSLAGGHVQHFTISSHHTISKVFNISKSRPRPGKCSQAKVPEKANCTSQINDPQRMYCVSETTHQGVSKLRGSTLYISQS